MQMVKLGAGQKKLSAYAVQVALIIITAQLATPVLCDDYTVDASHYQLFVTDPDTGVSSCGGLLSSGDTLNLALCSETSPA